MASFRFEVITAGADTFQLPIYNGGTYNFNVDWGDGSDDDIAAWDDAAANHSYAGAGTWDVVITGTITGWRFYNGGDKTLIYDISEWGPLLLGDNNGYFYGCSNLTVSATDTLDVSGVTDMSYAFTSCTSLTTVPSMSSWDVSSVTNMSVMFQSCTNFNQDIDGWDVSSVTSMSYMFRYAYAFNQNLNSWVPSLVTDFRSLFQNATIFNGNISSWNVSSGEIFVDMFRGAPAFNSNIGSWNTGNVTNMANMFMQCTDFNQDIGGWDTSKVTSMSTMFHSAIVFDQDIGGWETGNVIDFSSMFYGCSVFNQDLDSWDTSKATSMSYMFFYCELFAQDLNSWDTTEVTTMLAMFQYAFAFNGNITSWETGKVTSMAAMFFLTLFNQDISGWDTGLVESMSSLFRNCYTFNQDISGWDTSSNEICSNMFRAAISFDQDVGGWDITSLSAASRMFDSVTLSPANYNSLLVGWEAQAELADVTFSGGNSLYSADAPATARQALVDNGWTITDGGVIELDVGADCTDRSSSIGGGTVICKENPANVRGTITSVCIYGAGLITGIEFASFSDDGGGNFTSNGDTNGSDLSCSNLDTFTSGGGDFTAFAVSAGEVLGYFCVGSVEAENAAGGGIWWSGAGVDKIPTSGSENFGNTSASWVTACFAKGVEIVSTEVDFSIAVNVAMAVASAAVAGAAITLTTYAGITSSSLLIAGLSDLRKFVVPLETRSHIVPNEIRVHVVPSEDRTNII